MQHHVLNLALQASVLLLPVIVTTLLSPTVNAWFYVALMIAGFVFLIPGTLTIVLHAMNSAQQTTLSQKARMTIGLSFMAGLLANCLLQFMAPHVLAIFGSSYTEATWCLRILLLAVFPLIIKNHYISFCRIQDRVTQAMLWMIPGATLEVIAAILGARFGGLTGLSAGWVTALCIELLFMLHTVYKMALPSGQAVTSGGKQLAPSQGVRLIDTSPLAENNRGNARTNASWLLDTMPLPMLDAKFVATEAPWLINTLVLPNVRSPIGGAEREFQRNDPALTDRVNWPSKSRYARLGPTRLKPYLLPTDGVSVTDPIQDDLFLKQVCDDSPIVG